MPPGQPRGRLNAFMEPAVHLPFISLYKKSPKTPGAQCGSDDHGAQVLVLSALHLCPHGASVISMGGLGETLRKLS